MTATPRPTEAHASPATRDDAIAAMCRECIYDDLEPGTWREQCAACTVAACPLYAFRPVPDVRLHGRRLSREEAATHVRAKLAGFRRTLPQAA